MSQVTSFQPTFPIFPKNRKWNLEKFKFSRLICDRFTRCLIWKISHCACTRNPPLLSSFIGAKETTIVCEREDKIIQGQFYYEFTHEWNAVLGERSLPSYNGGV
uniref:Uncharacterized protein n=1 Tax=Cacopsylla melanoneura TaxID=428564 RepID=A0A8D9ARW8_9HEMI